MASLRHVQRGQPLNIRADDWNRIVDATRAFYEQAPGRGGPATVGTSGGRQASVIRVKNASGQDQPRFAVLGIDGPIIPPDEHEAEFQRQVALSCVTPTAEHGASGGGRFVVLQEPLADGAIGRACVSGVTVVRLQVENEDDTIADVADGESAHLVSGTSGNAVILWKEAEGEGDTSGGRWAIVRIGGGGDSAQLLIRITGSSVLADNRWSYAAVEVVPEKQGRYKDKANGWSGTAYNTIEASNAATGILGSGDNTADFPSGVELQPIGSGAVVPAWRVINCEGVEEIHFAAPNNPGGTCES